MDVMGSSSLNGKVLPPSHEQPSLYRLLPIFYSFQIKNRASAPLISEPVMQQEEYIIIVKRHCSEENRLFVCYT